MAKGGVLRMKYVIPVVTSGGIMPLDTICHNGYTCNSKVFDATVKCKDSYFECNSKFKCVNSYVVG